VIETGLPDIWYGHGAGWGQEEPTVQQLARMGMQAFGLQFAGDRQGERRYIVSEDSAVNAVTEQELKTRLGAVSAIVPTYQITEAASLLAVSAGRGRGPINALAQSKSAGGCIIAAYASPEAFSSIVLAFPGNLTGPQTGPIPFRIARDGIVRRLYPSRVKDNFGAKDGPGFAR
jgi:hypothetical protein